MISARCRSCEIIDPKLHRAELAQSNPMARVKMPNVGNKVVPTFPEREQK